MGIRLFYLSLLILSLAMGVQFSKNRPKTVPKQPKRPAASINLDDLDLHRPDDAASPSADATIASGTEAPDWETASASAETATGPEDIATQDSASAARPHEDPVLFAFSILPRNPFEPSPFAKMVEQAQASAAAMLAVNPSRASRTKPTEVMATSFGGTIETKNALVAIIDRKVYRTGEVYLGKTIRKIEKTHVTLDDPEKIYLLPKIGVKITLSSDTLSVVDEFMKNRGQ